jgi:hypothetical protein
MTVSANAASHRSRQIVALSFLQILLNRARGAIASRTVAVPPQVVVSKLLLEVHAVTVGHAVTRYGSR